MGSYFYLVVMEVISVFLGKSHCNILIKCILVAGTLSDLWAYNISLGNWTLKGGTNSINSQGSFPASVGQVGVPPSRTSQPASCTSDNGLLYLFGGHTSN